MSIAVTLPHARPADFIRFPDQFANETDILPAVCRIDPGSG
jgi:hypothetical protein